MGEKELTGKCYLEKYCKMGLQRICSNTTFSNSLLNPQHTQNKLGSKPTWQGWLLETAGSSELSNAGNDLNHFYSDVTDELFTIRNRTVPTNTSSAFSLADYSEAAHNCSGHEVVLKAQNDVDQSAVHTSVTGTISNQSIMLTSLL